MTEETKNQGDQATKPNPKTDAGNGATVAPNVAPNSANAAQANANEAANNIATKAAADCVECSWVFISPVPGSQVIINGTKKDDGLKRDVFAITFAPVGEVIPHPIIMRATYRNFGMYVTDDPRLAWVLQQSTAKGNAQYWMYDKDDPEQAHFHAEVYAIETPAG